MELPGVRQQLTDANAEIRYYKDIDGIKKSAADWETKYNTDTAALNTGIENLQKERVAGEFLSGQGFKSSLAKKAALVNYFQRKTSAALTRIWQRCLLKMM